ncbi:IS5 family transposase domain protein [Candidatus Bealeia paramacronuclearis]|uniref:IS5 family transposase domain protein n=1 Tax=Candidatus Bealeia paramacronuclearis TaxID=1921001 RepID=A0ABZ2C663_9PROT|nr:IS5 family transposase domain protein [Candidatus Bealeia paramacronuclearis]
MRKVWRKLSLATDEHGEIIAATLTNHTNSDCNQVDPLLRQIDAPIAEAIADSAYD